jgi:hypothetical protein
VGIGGALVEARSEAGLTIAQVSERTRIRETIIRGIEHDDYSACGGDYYARGHIRAIARVVGADPVPLIAAYDAARTPPPEPEVPADDETGHGWRLPGWHRMAGDGLDGLGFNGKIHSGNGQSADPAVPNGRGGGSTAPATGPMQLDDDTDPGAGPVDPRPLNIGPARRPAIPRPRPARVDELPGTGVPGGITAAEAFRPSMPLEPRRTLPRPTATLAIILLAAIGGLIYLLVSGGSTPASSHHGSGQHSSGQHSSGHNRTHHGSGAVARPVASTPPTVSLAPVSATAFGPSGAGQGDNPQEAPLAIAGSDSSAWQSDWYATANFAGLQAGTGLLLDMGKPVTVTSVQLLLAAQAGGTLELRAGNTPALADLPVVAQVNPSGGQLTVGVSAPVKARYLLIWFTQLPPDSSGTYQASVANVRLSGTT